MRFDAVEDLTLDFQLCFQNGCLNRLSPNFIVPVRVGRLGSFAENPDCGTGVVRGVFSDMFKSRVVDDAVRKPSAGVCLKDSNEFLIGILIELNAVTVPQPALQTFIKRGKDVFFAVSNEN